MNFGESIFSYGTYLSRGWEETVGALVITCSGLLFDLVLFNGSVGTKVGRSLVIVVLEVPDDLETFWVGFSIIVLSVCWSDLITEVGIGSLTEVVSTPEVF